MMERRKERNIQQRKHLVRVENTVEPHFPRNSHTMQVPATFLRKSRYRYSGFLTSKICQPFRISDRYGVSLPFNETILR